MAATIQISDGLSPALARLIAAGEDMSPVMAEIAADIETSTRLRFDTGIAPDGTRWAESERRKEQGGRHLFLSGDLLGSINANHGSDFMEVGPEASFGSAVYARIHNEGGIIQAIPKSAGGAGALRTPFGPRGSVTMPKRQYLGFSPGDIEDIGDAITSYLSTAWSEGRPS